MTPTFSDAQAADERPSAMPSGRNAKPVVGVYYYPWYRKPPRANAGQWMHVMRLPDKMPLDEGGKSEPPEAPIR